MNPDLPLERAQGYVLMGNHYQGSGFLSGAFGLHAALIEKTTINNYDAADMKTIDESEAMADLDYIDDVVDDGN